MRLIKKINYILFLVFSFTTVFANDDCKINDSVNESWITRKNVKLEQIYKFQKWMCEDFVKNHQKSDADTFLEIEDCKDVFSSYHEIKNILLEGDQIHRFASPEVCSLFSSGYIVVRNGEQYKVILESESSGKD